MNGSGIIFGGNNENKSTTGGTHKLPPHPYALGDVALRRLVFRQRSQAFIISGDSGAGKTETAKVLVDFLVEGEKKVVPSSTGTPFLTSHAPTPASCLPAANLVLEAFGNATTVRNRNSSRFGKFSALNFNAVPQFRHASIQTFLLEASRVSRFDVSAGERCFHVFYGLFLSRRSGSTGNQNKEKQAKPNANTSSSTSPCGPLSKDETSWHTDLFEKLKQALKTLDIGEEKTAPAWDILRAIVLLGELRFAEKHEECGTVTVEEEALGTLGQGGAFYMAQKVTSELRHDSEASRTLVEDSPGGGESHAWGGVVPEASPQKEASSLLGFPSWEAFKAALLKKDVFARGERITTSRSIGQVRQCLTAVRKTLYKRLFDQVVAWLNRSLSGKKGKGCSGSSRSSTSTRSLYIGILDIYGFEQLTVNSFEQLCINLANERLQQFFEQNFMEAERQLYLREGILTKAEQEQQSLVGGGGGKMNVQMDHVVGKNSTNVVEQGAVVHANESPLNNSGTFDPEPLLASIGRVFGMLDAHLASLPRPCLNSRYLLIFLIPNPLRRCSQLRNGGMAGKEYDSHGGRTRELFEPL
ncbi:unnamed protein product [Amoebophrya sp. A25]|nr:unnamed protein product [Amoebophrya sp. A25]|eukprot:GSA25T00019400001.1